MELQVRKPIELEIRGVLIKGDVIFRKYTCSGGSWSPVQKYCDIKRADGKPITKLQHETVSKLSESYSVKDQEFKIEFDSKKRYALNYMYEALTMLKDMIEKAENNQIVRLSQCYFNFQNYRDILELGTYESLVRE